MQISESVYWARSLGYGKEGKGNERMVCNRLLRVAFFTPIASASGAFMGYLG